MSTTTDTWTPAPKALRHFNGLRITRAHRDREYGIFREPHTIAGCYWSVRRRPIDQDGNATDSWGHPIELARTQAEAIRAADSWIERREQ